MIYLKNILFSIFVSFEFLFILLSYITFVFYSQPFIWVSDLFINNNLLSFSNSLPFTFLLIGLKLSYDIIIPSHAYKYLFIKWEGHNHIKATVFIGLLYIILSLIITSFLSYANLAFKPQLIGYLLILSYALAIISFTSLYLASINVQIVLGKNT